MYFKSKKTSLIIFILSLVLSRGIFMLVNDPEGPNLLIVVVLAVIIYALALVVYLLSTHAKRKTLQN